jgi:hypothetical protein
MTARRLPPRCHPSQNMRICRTFPTTSGRRIRRSCTASPLRKSEPWRPRSAPLRRSRSTRAPAREPQREPTATTWKPGAAPHLKHGLRTRRPAAVTLDPLVAEIEEALAGDLPVRDADGGVPAADAVAVELAAVQLLTVRRATAYLALHGDTDPAGNLRPELELLGRATERALRALDRLGMSPQARARLGLTVASMGRALHSAREADDADLLSPDASELMHRALALAARREAGASDGQDHGAEHHDDGQDDDHADRQDAEHDER